MTLFLTLHSHELLVNMFCNEYFSIKALTNLEKLGRK